MTGAPPLSNLIMRRSLSVMVRGSPLALRCSEDPRSATTRLSAPQHLSATASAPARSSWPLGHGRRMRYRADMRILSIVTLISPNGEYGGPVRVAVNQARTLMERGHDVTIAGGHRGFESAAPVLYDGVPAVLFPARTIMPGAGFAGLTAPGLRRWLSSNLQNFEVVHIHAARDLVTLPAAYQVKRARVPFVLQTHGMIDPSSHPLARPLDALLTRRILKSARRVFYLTPEERRGLEAVGGNSLSLQELSNGVPVPDIEPHREPGSVEVLFLARLAPRKRPGFFVKTASTLAPDYPDVRFTLVGPDEGEGAATRAAIDEAKTPRLSWDGPLAPEATSQRMARSSIYVLPSVDEPFPMSVLEAMSLGLPVVITKSCGLAEIVRRAECGLVINETQSGLDDAVRFLLDNPDIAEAMGQRGAKATRKDLSMGRVADILELAYNS